MKIADLNDIQLLSMLETADLARLPRASYGHGLDRAHRLASAAQLVCPPTYKEYQGHVGVGWMRDERTDSDWWLFCGWTTYGPSQNPQVHCNPHGWSADLSEIIADVNKTLKSKVRKGYHNRDGWRGELLDRDEVLASIQSLADCGQLAVPVC